VGIFLKKFIPSEDPRLQLFRKRKGQALGADGCYRSSQKDDDIYTEFEFAQHQGQ
jgi:hypothetical protein